MCGIAGGININEMELNEMLNMMLHRGSDNLHVEAFENIKFGSNILPIVCRVKYSQPIMNERNALVFNGEIYNYLELIRHHNKNCIDFVNDAHALFNLLSNGKIDYNDLNGQFAFAYIEKCGAIKLVRDYPGIAPLFYSSESERFAFASESKALESIGFKNIEVVLPGTEVIYSNGVINVSSWFKLKPKKLDNPIDQLDELLRQAVYEQVEYGDAENKIGIMVSGGVDSSLLAYYTTCFKKDVYAFTIDGMDNKYSKMLCQELSLKQIVIDASLFYKEKSQIYKSDKYNQQFSKLNNSLYVPTYIISEVARKYGIRILLTGDGVDELFGGYDLQGVCKGFLNDVLNNMLNSVHSYSLERLDLACMANTIEPRTPFLSRNIVDTAFSIGEEYKIRPEGNKWIIRKIAEKYIPKELAWREKYPMQVSTESYEMLYGEKWENSYM